ncbi:hypothetical protein A9264_07225 [Vibrio sp. UCD-FRSSP16_10]|uniref:hypothetical protein n=1 Tax=unclassified Vibrio TaxID=2614977 RepID=UPI0007FD4661|nr:MULTISPECIES: hypothetical protein [unclassified Vibrio]OBT13449.1 hypothetical protein A9264_07225 [Vibrio sp. UCD-FRSSP16_10]OBT17959.1 hypothetical protein A9260_01215 [Vibrio sp. UCD-FRSSP16_30]
MSNMGKITKVFYSSNTKVASLVKEAISIWPYGYCEFTSSLPEDNGQNLDEWFVELTDRGSDSNNKTIIDAYLHLGCGFSFVDIYEPEMERWLASGDQFETLTITSTFKELGYEVYHAVARLKSELYDLNREIKALIITSVGKNISLVDHSLFSSIIQSNNIYGLANGCHLDNVENAYIKLHIAIGSKLILPDSDIPEFLRK